jgi:predicted nucleotidyltransferase component of viral defense system
MKIINLDTKKQQEIINSVSQKTGLSPVSIEKDWWVVQVLHALFSLPYCNHLSFKGGTSLSKCWHLIERFSEDVDIAIDQEFLGFEGLLSKTQISDKLRRASCSFVRERLHFDLQKQLKEMGIDEDAFSVSVNITPVTATDPEVITIGYRSVFNQNDYIPNAVKIEVSGRSMSEPVIPCKVRSIIDECYPNAIFSEHPVEVRAVAPERSFLEKLFLLHEELAKPSEQIRVSRMSRHIYDLARLYDSGIADKALDDEDLYRRVIEHRRMYIGLRGFDYNELYPPTLRIIPQDSIGEQWREDYKAMREQMVYGDAPTYDELIGIMSVLIDRISQLPYRP